MLISSASVILGPSLGGQIIESFGWRAMLWVCVAICVATFVFCLTTARGKGDHPHRTFQTFDWSGAILVVVFFSLLLCIPSFGQNFGWTSWAFGGVTVAAVISLLGLIRAERKAFSPVLPGSFIGRKAFLLSVLTLFLTQGLMQANMTNTIVFLNYTQPDRAAISG